MFGGHTIQFSDQQMQGELIEVGWREQEGKLVSLIAVRSITKSALVEWSIF